MSEPKKPAKPRAPRKTKSKPGADATDPFVPDEFGVIPQTGDGLTIKGVPLVFVPGEAETIQGLNSAFLPAGKQPAATPFPGYFAEPTMNREEAIDRMSRLSTPLPTNSADEKNVGDRFQQDNSTLDAGEHENAGLDAGTTQVDSIATIPNWIPLDLPGKPRTLDRKDGSEDRLQQTPQAEPTTGAENTGDIAIGPAVADSNSPADSLESSLIARARDGETKSQCWERLRRQGRASGMTRKGAIAYASGEIERLFPPPEPVIEPIIEEIPDEPGLETSTIVDELPPQAEPIPEVAPPAPPQDLGVSGLGELPESWGNLPANAQLQVEIAWVSANRLRVRSGNGVDLSRALSPAPSYSALSWLETSILFPSKFADISVKATADQDDEREHIKREKMAIEEIRSILAEMLEG